MDSAREAIDWLEALEPVLMRILQLHTIAPRQQGQKCPHLHLGQQHAQTYPRTLQTSEYQFH